jgi:predicted ATPase with chaperone activity
MHGIPRKVRVANSGGRVLYECNLAAADLKKDADGFDLPIASGLLLGSGQVVCDRPGSYALVGELALTGETRPIEGVLAMALQADDEKRDDLLVPIANATEADFGGAPGPSQAQTHGES